MILSSVFKFLYILRSFSWSFAKFVAFQQNCYISQLSILESETQNFSFSGGNLWILPIGTLFSLFSHYGVQVFWIAMFWKPQDPVLNLSVNILASRSVSFVCMEIIFSFNVIAFHFPSSDFTLFPHVCVTSYPLFCFFAKTSHHEFKLFYSANYFWYQVINSFFHVAYFSPKPLRNIPGFFSAL